MSSKAPTQAIDRAKTALSRNNFSTPVQHLLETQVLTSRRSFFDFGCGKGDDIAGLKQLGFTASGWDPHYMRTEPKATADVVNLGFVLNVIEDPKERREALQEAWRFTKGALIVSVISSFERPANGLQEFADGHVTQKGTFQRYFEPGELKEYVEDVLSREPIPASPFSVLCFKDAEMEAAYVAHTTSGLNLSAPIPTHPLRKTRLNKCIERFQAEFPDRWAKLFDMVTTTAAAPPAEALSAEETLSACGVTPQDLLNAVAESIGDESWAEAVRVRRDRLVSSLALAFFRGKPKASHYPWIERHAVKSHFGSFRAAVELAQSVLFSIGDPEIISRECAKSNCGHEDEQALYVHRSCVPKLGPVLQTYIGAGRLFHGDMADVDVFKIHKHSGKLTLLMYENFDDDPEPILNLRVKIDFRARRVDYFDHRREAQKLTTKPAILRKH